MKLCSIKCVSNGSARFTMCINNEGDVYSFGYSSLKSHGNETFSILNPQKINNLTNIKSISCGSTHSLCLDYNENVFSFGFNREGQLGINLDYRSLSETHIPQQIRNIPLIKQISCGEFFSICLSKQGDVYSFGSNYYGQLGLGFNRDERSPQKIHSLSKIDFIICGDNFVFCISCDNHFFSWGYNVKGELGQGNNTNCNKPIQCLNWPDNIISIKCGASHSLLLTSDGQVYSFGCNKFGQLGIDDKNIKSINIPTLIKDIPEIQRIECGSCHSMCIDINNNLWIFGANSAGQLGLGDTEKKYKPILNPTLSNIIDISSGGEHTFVKTIDNKIYAFGKNNKSQLGIKTSNSEQLTPIQVLKGKEDIWCSTIGKSKAKSARK